MKKMMMLALALLLCGRLAVPASAAEFSDVGEDHWARADIEKAAELGIVSGYADGTFRPDAGVTNAQFAVMLSRAFFPEEVEQARDGSGAWYWANLSALHELGVLQGTSMAEASDWESRAGRRISRYNMARMAANILELRGKTAGDAEKAAAAGKIADYDYILSSEYAGYGDAVASVCALGIISGYADGTFSGMVNMNRAQSCVVIGRLSRCLGTAVPTLADGSEMTEENVRRLIETLRPLYPDGMRWTNDNSYYSPVLNMNGHGCAAFAFRCSDTVFGSLPISATHSDFDRVRVGDIVRMDNNTHSVIVLEKHAGSITIAEGNYNSEMRWGREVSRAELEAGHFTVRTRWPA